MKIEDKIYKLGLMALDELLLHRNISKETVITIEDASILKHFVEHFAVQEPTEHQIAKYKLHQCEICKKWFSFL
jgi:hypothetical protein